MTQTTTPVSQALKVYSAHMTAQIGKQNTPIKMLSGPLSMEKAALNRMEGQSQSSPDMPIVQVADLNKSGKGDTVYVDCVNITPLTAIMGDKNAEGLGSPLVNSRAEFRLNVTTMPISVGGQMAQQRTHHSLYKTANMQLRRAMPALEWQRVLVHAAGARGSQQTIEWSVPLQSDTANFAEVMINPVMAPSYNRHFVVNAGNITAGGAQLASVVSTDVMKLSHIDALGAMLDEMAIRMQPVIIPGDPLGGMEPIKGILMVCPLVWDSLMMDTTAQNNIRNYQAAALKRAGYNGIREHPLFAGDPFLWRGILVKKMDYGIRFDASATTKIVTAANRLTATESDVTVNSALSTTNMVSRSVLLASQGIAKILGANKDSGMPYSILENRTNYGRNLELAGEMIGGEGKIRFSLPNANKEQEPTDFGCLVLDSVVKKIAT